MEIKSIQLHDSIVMASPWDSIIHYITLATAEERWEIVIKEISYSNRGEIPINISSHQTNWLCLMILDQTFWDFFYKSLFDISSSITCRTGLGASGLKPSSCSRLHGDPHLSCPMLVFENLLPIRDSRAREQSNVVNPDHLVGAIYFREGWFPGNNVFGGLLGYESWYSIFTSNINLIESM